MGVISNGVSIAKSKRGISKTFLVLAIPLALAACATVPQSPLIQPNLANSLESFRNRCTDYGFQQGSPSHAECVQKLDWESRADVSKRLQDRCAEMAKEVAYWCSERPAKSGTGAFGAYNCGAKLAERNQVCR